MKYIIESDELRDHELALNGFRLALVVTDMQEHLRGLTKYQGKEEVSVEELREELRGFIENRGVPWGILE